MELNREEIIKALECCTRGRKSKDDYPCDGCPYNECNLVGGTGERQIFGTCQGWLMKDTLALVRELTEENKDLRATNKVRGETIESLQFFVSKLTEDNERLRAFCTELAQCCTKLETLYKIECKRVDTIKADTVRKMQEGLTLTFDRMHKTNFMTPEVRQWIIDQIAKEKLEETDEV